MPLDSWCYSPVASTSPEEWPPPGLGPAEFQLKISVRPPAGLRCLPSLDFITWTSLPFRYGSRPPNLPDPLASGKGLSYADTGLRTWASLLANASYKPLLRALQGCACRAASFCTYLKHSVIGYAPQSVSRNTRDRFENGTLQLLTYSRLPEITEWALRRLPCHKESMSVTISRKILMKWHSAINYIGC